MENYMILKKARYKDPKFEVEKSKREGGDKKTLVVMNTYLSEDNKASYNTRSYVTHLHSSYTHDRLKCLEFTLECYKYFDAGADYDFIIVDNDSPSKQLEGILNKRNLWFEKRENTFYSFGSYKYAWDKYGKDYDYFVFHEFDWVPAKHGWLKDLIDYWNSDKNIGMIGNLIEQRGYNPKPRDGSVRYMNEIMRKVNPDRDFQYNLDSEYMFIDKNVLLEMENHGGWNLFKCSPEVDESPIINELGFQQPILEMGYDLACYNDGEHTMFYAIYNNGFPEKWWNGFDKLAPFIPEQTRLFVPEVRDYFRWYDHAANWSLV